MVRLRNIVGVLVAVIGLGLAACGGGGGLPGSAPRASLAGALMLVTGTGVGPLGAGTGYANAALTAALPGYRIAGMTMATESRTQSAFGVYLNGILVLQVLSGGGNGRIGAVHAVTDAVAGPNGERIGMSYGQIQPNRSSCRAGTGNWLGMAICESRGAANVKLVFSVLNYRSGALPSAEALQSARLNRIIWTPA